MEKRQGVTEASLIRPLPVLVLSNNVLDEGFIDLWLSFNEGKPESFTDSRGHYDVFVSPELGAAAVPWSRAGTGAALFNGSGKTWDEPLVLKPRAGRSTDTLFAPGSQIRDFSIEFWLYPQNMENGGQILSWSSSKRPSSSTAAAEARQGRQIDQRVQCLSSKNRLQWIFQDFFFSPDKRESKSLSLSGPPVLPRTWSHHLIRFDADLGLLEYLVDGKLEALDYTTSSGREGGDVFVPVIGEDSRFALGSHFSGMMDEFRIYRCYLEIPDLAKYPSQGGRTESRTLDLGHANSQLLRLEAFGGRTTMGTGAGSAGRVRNEYAGNGNLSFQDHSGVNFFVRFSNEPYRWNDVPWVPVRAGTELPDTFRGRFVQIAADFYPSGDGGTTPYLAELKLVYRAAEPPHPPVHVAAVAKDGAVELSWKASSSKDVGGYFVYYGTARGEYFGANAKLGNTVRVSPIDAGNRTSLRIEGLTNGTLYYFAVAAYNKPHILDGGAQVFLPEPGEFSREAAARPLLRPTEDS